MAEVAALAAWASRRAAERSFAAQDLVLVGDVNLPLWIEVVTG